MEDLGKKVLHEELIRNLLETKYILLIDVYDNPKFMLKYFPDFWKSHMDYSIFWNTDKKKLFADQNLYNVRKHFPYLTLFINSKNEILASNIGLSHNKTFITTIKPIILKNISKLINNKEIPTDNFHVIRDTEKPMFRKVFGTTYKHLDDEKKYIYVIEMNDDLVSKIYKSRIKGIETIREKIKQENDKIIYEIETRKLNKRYVKFVVRNINE